MSRPQPDSRHYSSGVLNAAGFLSIAASLFLAGLLDAGASVSKTRVGNFLTPAPVLTAAEPSQVLDTPLENWTLYDGTVSGRPFGFVDGPNLYAYVRQNPWTKFDPEGLAAAEAAMLTNPFTGTVVVLGALQVTVEGAYKHLLERAKVARGAEALKAAQHKQWVHEQDYGPQGTPATPVKVPELSGTPATPQNPGGTPGFASTGPQTGLTLPGADATPVKLDIQTTPGQITASDRITENYSNSNGHLVRFGPDAESASALGEGAAAAEAAGYPHGVSTFLKDRISGSDKKHRSAPFSQVESEFEVQQTGRNPAHHTVVLPKPVTQEVADRFNGVFEPKTEEKNK